MNSDRLQHLLRAAKGGSFLVVGDVMLDEFVWGRVSRISPEAPVPVVEVERETAYPGGAANVARNLRPFCREVHLCGLVGEDTSAQRLRHLLEEEKLCASALVADAGRPTIVKTRIVARQQQVVRVDRERRRDPDDSLVEMICERVASLLPGVEAMIFEDYGKGFLTATLKARLTTLARTAGLFIAADPNPSNPLDWSGVDLLKPNRAEAFAMAGRRDPGPAADPLSDAALLETGRLLQEKWQLPTLLVTLGEHGMMLFQAGHAPYHTPTRAKEVFDVSGAGDTAIALYTLAVRAGATPSEAAEISNHASGVVVAKLGTATLTVEELCHAFRQDG
jgi:D-beta-D-heptose 7-phosphate kinase/D-beta-D-heptose 1-phosphate adenosyltransferase